jgi:hypothetical protein
LSGSSIVHVAERKILQVRYLTYGWLFYKVHLTWMKHGLTKITAQIICGFRMMGLMPQKYPLGKGKHLIVLHAGTRSEGLIDGCDLVFLTL